MDEGSKVKTMYSGTKVVWYILSLIEASLVFRFFLKVFGANPVAGFTYFIYSVSGFFVEPFRYVFPAPDVGTRVFEFSTLLAMVVYWIVAWGIVRLIVINRPVSSGEASHRIRKQDST